VTEITVKAGQEVTLILDNQDLSSDEGHNIHVRTNTNDYFTAIHTAPDTQEIVFTIADAGTYTFFCDTHPTQMLGTFTVTP
jgi:plastocyanin